MVNIPDIVEQEGMDKNNIKSNITPPIPNETVEIPQDEVSTPITPEPVETTPIEESSAENTEVTPTREELGITPWKDIFNKPEYQGLETGQQAKLKLQYFDTLIAPNIPEYEYTSQRSQFLNHASRLEINKDNPSWIAEQVHGIKRTGGIFLGLLNAPSAFGLGALVESESRTKEQQEEYNKLNLFQKSMIPFGAAFDAAFNSVIKEGSMGAMYGDYYKSVTGKTIEEALPNNLKWAAPTLEFLAELPFDPLIIQGSISDVIKKGIPKEWVGQMPKRMLDDLKKIEALDDLEKSSLQTRFIDILKGREDYMKWWAEQPLTPTEIKLDTTGSPLIKRTSGILKAEKPKDFGIKVVLREEAALTTQLKTTPKSTAKKGVSIDAIKAGEKTNKFRQEKGLPPLAKFPKEQVDKWNRLKATKNIEEFRKSKGLPPLVRAEAGALAGFEIDDEGNIYYDVRKGALGVAASAGGIKIVKAFNDTKSLSKLSNNPSWAKVASGIGHETHNWTFAEVLQKINKSVFDRFAVLKNASPETYEKAITFSSWKDNALYKFRPLVEAFNPVKKDNFTISTYIKAHRDLIRAERGFSNPVDTTIYKTGISIDDAKNSIKEIETDWVASGKNLDDLQSTLDAFNQWTHDEILSPMYDAGFLSKKSYEDIIKNNRWYAAYDVIEHMPDNIDNIPMLASKEFFSVSNQNIIKSIKGTEKQIVDPIEATIKKFTTAQYNIARNDVAKTLIDDANIKPFTKPIATSEKELASMKSQGLDPFMEGGFSKKEWGQINLFRDGNVERYAVPKELADTMKQLSTQQANKFVTGYNAIFRASATTLSLPFLIRNVPRDFIIGYISSPYHGAGIGLAKFTKDWGTGAWEVVKHELGKPSLVDDYIKSGGSFGWAGSEAFEGGGKVAAKKLLFEKSGVGKAADIITTPFKLVSTLNEIAEMAPRMGIFDRGMKVGADITDAALAGRRATIDFNRGGTFLKVANQYIPFLNARVQAKVTLVDAIKRDPKGTIAKAVTLTTIPGLSAYAWNRLYFSDEYDDIPENIRQDNFCIVYGTEQDEEGKVVPKYLAIPKGDAGTLFNPIEFGLDSKFKDDNAKRGTQEFLINFLSDMSPLDFAREGKLSASKLGSGVLPPITKAPLEDWANLKFYQGTEVVPYYMGKSKPPELQYKESTPEFYKKMGEITGVSPLRLQNYGSNILTTYGRIGFSPTAMLNAIKGAIVKTQGGDHERRAWVVIKDIENGYNTARAYAEEMIKNNDTQGALNLMQNWNEGINNQIDEFNSKFAKYGIEDKGGIAQSYGFTRAKSMNLIRNTRKESGNPLDKKLSRRKK